MLYKGICSVSGDSRNSKIVPKAPVIVMAWPTGAGYSFQQAYYNSAIDGHFYIATAESLQGTFFEAE